MTLLEARGVTKQFAGITALDRVDLDVASGESVGLIGHTKSDAMETVAHLVADAREGRLDPPTLDADVVDLLDARQVAYTTWDGWLALDAHERELGETHRHQRERVKVVPRDEQVAISRSGALIGT